MGVVLLVAGLAACIEIPPNIHAEFAGPRIEDRSNYRVGTHGTALPFEDDRAVAGADAGAPEPKAAALDVADAGDAEPAAAADADAGDADGGAR